MELSYLNNPKSLFRKYARLVTSLSQHQLFRDYVSHNNLPLPKEPISHLLPNGYKKIVEIGRKKHTGQMIVTTRACYAPKLYPALQALDLVNNWVQDFDEASLVVMGQLGLIPWGRMPAVAKQFNFLTYTYVPDAHPETTSVDGYVDRNPTPSESWATIRGAAGDHADDTGVSMFSGADVDATGLVWADLLRSIALFDTSAFTGTLTAGSNTCGFYVVSVGAEGSLTNRLVTSTPASNTALATSDYSQLGTTTQATADLELATTSQYNNYTLSTAGENNLAIIGKLGAGITKYGIKLAGDADNSEPSKSINANYNTRVRQADNGSNKPTLTLTYTVDSSGRLRGNVFSMTKFL